MNTCSERSLLNNPISLLKWIILLMTLRPHRNNLLSYFGFLFLTTGLKLHVQTNRCDAHVLIPKEMIVTTFPDSFFTLGKRPTYVGFILHGVQVPPSAFRGTELPVMKWMLKTVLAGIISIILKAFSA
ncbi:MAG: hypothetical protein COA57_12185 [Flavobacteriales bacterium]|nr:MAG: hypothetical protein COA57_12185 [Flavobacteriales bacterium]